MEPDMTIRRLAMPFGMGVFLAACAQPLGPTVQVMPGPGHTFEAFQADQRVCSMAANAETKPMVDRAATMQLGTAVIGTVLGAGLGAAVGGGRGAAIGAGAGAIGGTGAAADQGNAYAGPIQDTYNNTYAACMASRGDQVIQPAAPTIVYQPPAVIVQPTPYYVQPTPYVVMPAPPTPQP
jgi:outer membrane lipoprotein SlyB